MGITLPLDKMTVAEKLEAIETLWNDISRDSAEVKGPVVLSKNGRPSVVVQDAKSYEELLETRERMETLRGIQKGMADAKAGRVSPSEEFFEEFFSKYNIPSKK